MRRFGLSEIPWCRVNFCSTTAVTRPRTLAGGSLRVASTDKPTNWAICKEISPGVGVGNVSYFKHHRGIEKKCGFILVVVHHLYITFEIHARMTKIYFVE